jgi:predicted outer membrane repeat protein
MPTNASNSFRARLALAFFLILGMLGVQLPKPVLAATFTVTNTNDSGPGSLREAILQQFNGNTIMFDPSLAGQTITLSSGLIINQDLTIDGSGLNPPVVLSGGYATRIIQTQGIADVTISDLTFTRGVSIAGGAIDMTGSSQLTLKNSTLYQNQASSSGGAISNRGNGPITILNSTFYQNQAGASGGAISIGFGPGTIVNSTFFDNNATGDGGAITSSLDLTLIDSTLSGNTAGNGGGAIFAFQPTIKNTVIYLNQASQGGAILIPGNGRGTIVNSTITQNQASASGGAIYMHGTTQVEVFNSTFAANNAPEGSEVSAIGRADFALYNTILACAPGNNGCIFEFGDISVGGPNSIIDTGTLESFGLGELADNGGPTQTMALLPQSLLIDAGDDLVCANSSVNNLDQRGVTRPQGKHCDIGAYEADYIMISGNVGVAGVSLSYTDAIPKTVTADNNGNYSIIVSVGWSGTVTPSKRDYTFTPANRSFSNIQSDQIGQNYTAQYVGGADTTGVFRPSNGALFLKNSNITGYADIQINYGLAGDYPVVGDWDGNGTVTIGIYRNGSFYLRNSNTIGFADIVFAFGLPGDQPIAGDWNGDGIDTIGVYRNGTFFLRNDNSNGAPSASFALGIPGDVGIAGDWDGNGTDTTGVFRPSNGALYLKNTNATGFADIQINYGLPGDKPVTGDWNGDGIDTIGIYRNGTFYLRNTNTIGFADIVFALGIPGDMPIAGNWDGLP